MSSQQDRHYRVVSELKSKNVLEAIITSYGRKERADLIKATVYLESDTDIFSMFYFAFRQCSSLKPGKRSIKSIKKAALHLAKGNKEQTSQQLHESIRSYSKSLCRLPEEDDPQHLWCYAYLNRGISLALLNFPDDAIMDCLRILLHPTIRPPDNIVLQVHFLMSCCYYMMENGRDGLQHWTFANLLAQKLYSVSALEVEATFKIHFGQFYSQTDVVHCEEPAPLSTPELTGGPNKELPNASKKIRLCYNETFGRHLVAVEDIKRGDVLIVEDPVVFTVDPKKKHKFCSFCFKKSHRLHPCTSCSKVMFCSPGCLEAAHKKFHAAECKVLQYASSIDFIDINSLPLRLLCTYGFHQILSFVNSEEKQQQQQSPRTRGFTGNKFQHDTLAAIHSLCTPSKTYFVSRFQQGSYAAFTALCMRDALKDSWSQLGGFILHCHHVVATNKFSIISQDRHRDAATPVGSGIYPTASLINHKCEDNVSISFHGTKIIVRAIQNIPKGQQVFTNYGINVNAAVKDIQANSIHFVGMHGFVCDCYFCNNNTCVYKLPKAEISTPALKLCCRKLECSQSLGYQVGYPEFAFNSKKLKLLFQYLDLLEKSGQKFTRDYFVISEEIRRHYRLKGTIFTCL